MNICPATWQFQQIIGFLCCFCWFSCNASTSSSSFWGISYCLSSLSKYTSLTCRGTWAGWIELRTLGKLRSASLHSILNCSTDEIGRIYYFGFISNHVSNNGCYLIFTISQGNRSCLNPYIWCSTGWRILFYIFRTDCPW